MIAATVVNEIERLLAEGRLSQRKIASLTGVSRGTVGAIASGQRVLQSPAPSALAEESFAPDAPIARCPICGAKVRMPCLACQLRANRERRRAAAAQRYRPLQECRRATAAW